MLKASKTIRLPLGDQVSFDLPKDMDPNGFVQIEPNCLQSADFFQPCIIRACQGVVTVENQSEEVIVMKKNSQPVQVQTTTLSPPKIKSDFCLFRTNNFGTDMESVVEDDAGLLQGLCDQEPSSVCQETLLGDTAVLGCVERDKEIDLASVSSWKDVQRSCNDLRRAHALMVSGRLITERRRMLKI